MEIIELSQQPEIHGVIRRLLSVGLLFTGFAFGQVPDSLRDLRPRSAGSAG